MKTFRKHIVFLLFILISCNLQKNKENTKFIYQQASEHLTNYQYARASVLFEKYLNTISDSTDTTYILSLCHLFYCYYRLGNKAKWTESINKLRKIEPYIDSLNIANEEKFKNDSNQRKIVHFIHSYSSYIESIVFNTLALYEGKNYNYHKANFYLKQAIALYPENDTNQILHYYRLGVFFERLLQRDSAHYYYIKALQLSGRKKDFFSFERSILYGVVAGYSFYVKNNFKLSEAYYDTMQLIMNNCHVVDSDYYAWNTYNLAVFNHHKGNLYEAYQLYQKAYDIYLKLEGNYEYELAHIAIGQALIDSYVSKHTLAESKINRAVKYFEFQKDLYSLAQAKYIQSQIYFNANKFNEALQGYFSILNLYNSLNNKDKEEIYYNIGSCYLEMNKPDSADLWLSKCREQLDKIKIRIIDIVTIQAQSYIHKNQPDKALDIINLYYPLVVRQYKTNNYRTGYYIYWKAKAHELCNQYFESLKWYENSIYSSLKTYKPSKDFIQVPEIADSNIISSINVIDALVGKADVLQKLGIKYKSTDYLLKSLKHYLRAIEIAEAKKKTFSIEADRLIFNETKTNVYERIFSIALQLYQQSNTESDKQFYINLAFSSADMVKANVLTQQMIENNLKKIAGIPDSILDREKAVNEEIIVLQNAIQDELNKNLPKHELIELWQKKLLKRIEESENFIKYFESRYPKYYELKYNRNKSVTINQIQTLLQNDENIIEYQIVGDVLYAFVINKNQVKVISVLEPDLKEMIFQFRQKLSQPNEEEFSFDGFVSYIQLAHRLYKTLFEVVKPYINSNNLILIPDKFLNYIPFEALVVSDSIPCKLVDYGMLNYLLNHYNIRYAYSARLFELQQLNPSPELHGVLAFAPSYQMKKNEKVNTRYAKFRDQLLPIPGAQTEARDVVKLLGGQCISGRNATEGRFKYYAQSKKILHLAMHAIIDDTNPLLSKLAFSQTTDSINDGMLHVYEIYNMQFSTPLVVLSACNTGYGKLLNGEGLYSLSRGFIFAECPALVVTLWSIADKTSHDVMIKFYNHLKNYQPIDLAIKHAKIQYIQNSDARLSHPYYWAAYIFTGKNKPIESIGAYHTTVMYISIILMLLAIGFIFIYYIKYREL